MKSKAPNQSIPQLWWHKKKTKRGVVKLTTTLWSMGMRSGSVARRPGDVGEVRRFFLLSGSLGEGSPTIEARSLRLVVCLLAICVTCWEKERIACLETGRVFVAIKALLTLLGGADLSVFYLFKNLRMLIDAILQK